jgi:hypothetical protein
MTMKTWIAAGIAGALAGGATSWVVTQSRPAPGSWFSTTGDAATPRVQVTQAASEAVVCLYASVRYKPGDVIDVKGAGSRIVCTAGPPDAGGVTSGVWLRVQAPDVKP